MKKKLIATMLTVAMTATMLAGCGSKTEEAAAPAEDTAATTEWKQINLLSVKSGFYLPV